MNAGIPCNPANAQPLFVTAILAGPVRMPQGCIQLDALLAAQVAQLEHVPHPAQSGELIEIEVPVLRESGGRFHLCSSSCCQVDEHERRWVNRRFDIQAAQRLSRMRRVHLSAGPTKSFRIPDEAVHLVDDRIDWWCVGDEERVTELLYWVTHLGRKRSSGEGRVRSWAVRQCEPWGDGFPLLTPDGYPTRPLPAEWPGLAEDAMRGRMALTYPYWAPDKAALCAAPEPTA